VDFPDEQRFLDSLTAMWEIELARETAAENSITKDITATLFSFNPNTITKSELKTLGFSDRLINGLLNYRLKGGQFRVKSDLKKLYGIDSAFFKTLTPFIQLPEKISYQKSLPEIIAKPELFNLNLADSSQFQRVYGIGPVLAKRIVKYRERLGGFVRTAQLYEVYGLDSMVVERLLKASFLPEGDFPEKLNINTADEKLLASHPYFSKKIAQAIVTYRFQHGNYLSVDDLRKINLIDEKILTKIYPYLTVD
jgi:DNA uptake protein ComE-like DNA-binding protein